MKQFVERGKTFLLLYVLFAIAGGAIIAVFEHGDEILYANSLHNPFADDLFKWITKLAEAPAFLLAFLFVFFSSYGKGLLLSINLGLVAGVVQFLKLIVFEGTARPAVFFENKVALRFVDGVEVFRHNSFPSGHTAIGFATFFMLALFTENRLLKMVFFVTALLIGISRVYLLQHFFRDIYAGAFIGVSVTALFWLTFAQSNFYNNLTWKNKAVLK